MHEVSERKKKNAGRGLAEISRFFFSSGNDPGEALPEPRQSTHAGIDLQHVISNSPREFDAAEPLICGLLSGSPASRISIRGLQASGKGAWVILDDRRRVRLFNEAAGYRLNLRPESRGQAFNYFFQPGIAMLVNIRQEDGSAGIGELNAVFSRYRRKGAYLITIRDITWPIRRHACPDFRP